METDGNLWNQDTRIFFNYVTSYYTQGFPGQLP